MSMASNGYPAADLMVVRLKQTNSKFPAEDAIRVLEYTHLQGANLLNHEAIHVLENLAASASDPALRKQAQGAIDLIRGKGLQGRTM